MIDGQFIGSRAAWHHYDLVEKCRRFLYNFTVGYRRRIKTSTEQRYSFCASHVIPVPKVTRQDIYTAETNG